MSSGDARAIRVVLVDDQTLVRLGIRQLLELADGIEVVGEAGDGVAALALIREVEPDVVLLDLRMPRLDGHGVLAELATWPAAPPVLVLTTFDDDEAVLGALRAGARGYLLKDVTLAQLVEAVRTLAAGGRLVQPAVTASLLDRLTGAPARAGRAGAPEAEPWRSGGPASGLGGHTAPVALTDRELDVLRLMAAGYSNREIAAGLHLAEGTVKNHVSAVLLKLGTRDRTRAVLKALELGLVTG
ncbi:MAG: response regulator transcription factor [Austwickia sp.]|nr:response regulator transcription factor [Actinomycetota bacterium]MCB1254705.1 response regulator transcription factor [Austwickia sp.]MCO5308542.1 response regulator transcription factor [Austwickia sp.]